MSVPTIYIDADACPVKEDTYKIAKRYGLTVVVVSNRGIQIPNETWIVPVIVEKSFDAVDAWIVENLKPKTIVITNDILLADKCVKKGAFVIDPRGRILNEDNIGEALATRELMYDLRQQGALDLGPKKMGKNHRSNYLANFDKLIHLVKKS